jgi:hypothetical protein
LLHIEPNVPKADQLILNKRLKTTDSDMLERLQTANVGRIACQASPVNECANHAHSKLNLRSCLSSSTFSPA